jgi:hypothetical protein
VMSVDFSVQIDHSLPQRRAEYTVSALLGDFYASRESRPNSRSSTHVVSSSVRAGADVVWLHGGWTPAT